MQTPHDSQLRAVRKLLDGRKLAYYGLRGVDAHSLYELNELGVVASLTGTAASRHGMQTVSHEELVGTRGSSGSTCIDKIRGWARDLIIDEIRSCVADGGLIASYMPQRTLERIAMRSRATILGNSRDLFNDLSDKPKTEMALAERGVRTIPQRYFTAGQFGSIAALLMRGPRVVRRSSSASGEALALIRTVEEARAFLVDVEPTAIVASSPYLEHAIPVSASGVVWSDGSLTLYPGSVQLIGIKGYTHRDFGYCGNDVAAFSQFDDAIVRDVETTVRVVGQYLHERGYVGAFGVDLMVDGDDVYYTELNARLLGTSDLFSDLMHSVGLPGIYLDHVAACLGGSAQAFLSLRDLRRELPPASRIVAHRVDDEGAGIWYGALESHAEIDMQVPFGVDVAVGGILRRIRFDHAVTATGRDLLAITPSEVSEIEAAG